MIGAAACVLLLSVPASPAAGQAGRSIEDLLLQRQVVAAELRQAQESRAQAWRNLRAARLAYDRALQDVRDAAAALWIGLPTDEPLDEGLLEGLEAGIELAKSTVHFAQGDAARVRSQLATIDGALALARMEERRREQAEAQARVAAQAARHTARQASTTTISCPVAAASAIYADFGAPRPGGPHRGIDIPAPTGTPALAAWWGTVRETPVGGWIGQGVVLEDSAGNTWWYAHLSRIDVEPGQTVVRGQQVGLVGSTGNSTGPHLHFEVHARGVTPVDPYSLVSPACGIADWMTPEQRVAYESSTDDAN